MSDEHHTTTATIPDRAAARTSEVHAAAERLRATLDTISRRATGDASDTGAPTPDTQDEALIDIYDWALDGWFEAPQSTLTAYWLQRLVDNTRLPIATTRAAAVVIAAREAHDAALAAAVDDSNSAQDAALRRMVLKALHVLGPDALRDLCATVPSGHHVQRLLEISCEAMRAGDLERVIAALAIPMAGMLSDAVARGTGRAGVWRRDPDELIAMQRCSRHNVFCCLQCPDAL